MSSIVFVSYISSIDCVHVLLLEDRIKGEIIIYSGITCDRIVNICLCNMYLSFLIYKKINNTQPCIIYYVKVDFFLKDVKFN